MNRQEVKTMKKNLLPKSEVLAFVEDLISMQMASEEVLTWYEEYQWTNKFKKNDTYKQLIKYYKELHNEKF
jgi:hypothetical protein